MRSTKIICTMGPNTDKKGVLGSMDMKVNKPRNECGKV